MCILWDLRPELCRLRDEHEVVGTDIRRAHRIATVADDDDRPYQSRIGADAARRVEHVG